MNTIPLNTEKKQSPLTIYPLLTKLIIVMLVVLGGILSFVIYQESKPRSAEHLKHSGAGRFSFDFSNRIL